MDGGWDEHLSSRKYKKSVFNSHLKTVVTMSVQYTNAVENKMGLTLRSWRWIQLGGEGKGEWKQVGKGKKRSFKVERRKGGGGSSKGESEDEAVRAEAS